MQRLLAVQKSSCCKSVECWFCWDWWWQLLQPSDCLCCWLPTVRQIQAWSSPAVFRYCKRSQLPKVIFIAVKCQDDIASYQVSLAMSYGLEWFWYDVKGPEKNIFPLYYHIQIHTSWSKCKLIVKTHTMRVPLITTLRKPGVLLKDAVICNINQNKAGIRKNRSQWIPLLDATRR